jgi:hypothetical protein
MMEFIKRLFKSPPEEKEEVVFDITNCDFLQRSNEEQNDQLKADGHFVLGYKYDITDLTIEQEVIPSRYKNSSMPIETSLRGSFSFGPDNLMTVLEPKQQVVIDTFEHLEKLLNQYIEIIILQDRIKLNNFLLGVEEINKKAITLRFFKGLYDTFETGNILIMNDERHLPYGVDKTNLLTRTYLVERDKKRMLLAENIGLIKMFLYCPDLLESKTLHMDYPNVSRLVEFCARRNFMIELNEKYGFEINHPYTFIHSNRLTHHYHSDLIAHEIDFDWVIKILMERKNAPNKKEGLTNTFCSRLTKVLKDEDCFKSGTTNAQFCTFLQSNFNTSFTKLRPDEALDTSPGRQEVEVLIESLITYRNSKN